MDSRTFIDVRNDFTNYRQMVADNKAQSYANDSDRLINFKRQAARWGVEPLVVLGVYLGKHLDAVEAYIRDDIESAEGVRSNIGDAMNYLDLLLAMVEEIEAGEGEV